MASRETVHRVGRAGEGHTLGRWSVDEDAFIVAHYGDMTLALIAKALDVDVFNLRAHTSCLRAQGKVDGSQRYYGRPWTADDEQELRGRWPHEDAAVIARAMHRSLASVRTRAYRLHLGRSGPGLTACKVAAIFGVDEHLVVYWLAHGWLKGRQTKRRFGRGFRWVITLQAVEDFIVATPYHFNWRAMSEEYVWREFARRETERQRWLTARQAARRLGCHVGTVHNHLRKGYLPGVQTTGASWQGDWRVREDDLRQFKARRPLHGHAGTGRPGIRAKADRS